MVTLQGTLMTEVRQKAGMKKVLIFRRELYPLNLKVMRKKINSGFKILQSNLFLANSTLIFSEDTTALEGDLLHIAASLKQLSPELYQELKKKSLVF